MEPYLGPCLGAVRARGWGLRPPEPETFTGRFTMKKFMWEPGKQAPGYLAIKRIRRYFPKVVSVSDATVKVRISVTEVDEQKAKAGEFAQCALAMAAKRELKADGALIGLAFSYLIKGTHATRYRTPEAVQREMVSFDRHKDFDLGVYSLEPAAPRNRLGVAHRKPIERANGTRKPTPPVHITSRVRRAVA